MNPLLSRTWQIVAVVLILMLVGTYYFLRFMGIHRPPNPTSADQGLIATLGDYVRYKEDPQKHSRDLLRFDCERIRDDFVRLTQSIVSPELATSAETMVWREGQILHLADPTAADHETFGAWKKRVIDLAIIQHAAQASHYATLLQSLFASVAIHGSNPDEEFSVKTAKSAFEECR